MRRDVYKRQATEFYAGLLVPGFPSDCRAVFERLRAASASLSEQLPGLVRSDGVLVVISGLDYDTCLLYTSRCV